MCVAVGITFFLFGYVFFFLQLGKDERAIRQKVHEVKKNVRIITSKHDLPALKRY